jgi:hypothetical protein
MLSKCNCNVCDCSNPANWDGTPTCPSCQWGVHAVPVELLPGDNWDAGLECDDCFRTDGTHNPEVEH